MTDKPQPFKTRERVKLSDFDPVFPDHVWHFWKNPDQKTFFDLFAPFDLLKAKGSGEVSPTDEADYYTRFYAAVSALVLDTGESNLDLSTPDLVRSLMESSQNHNEIIGGAALQYAQRILSRLNETKKKAEPPLNNSATGGDR